MGVVIMPNGRHWQHDRQVVVMTICDANNDDWVTIITTLGFQWNGVDIKYQNIVGDVVI